LSGLGDFSCLKSFAEKYSKNKEKIRIFEFLFFAHWSLFTQKMIRYKNLKESKIILRKIIWHNHRVKVIVNKIVRISKLFKKVSEF